MVNKDLSELRALARARHRAATKKISRLNRDVEVIVSGTKYDPRRNVKNISKYNKKQLESYINQLNAFQSRKTQFVPDKDQKPIRLEVWKRYKGTEQQYNLEVQKRRTRYDYLSKPGQDKPSDRQKRATPHNIAKANRTTNVDVELNRNSTSISSEENLDKLTRNLLDRMTPRHRDRVRDRNRRTVKNIISDYGDSEMSELFSNLTDEQFDYFWDFSPNEINSFFLWYMASKEVEEGSKQSYLAGISEDSKNIFVRFINEIKSTM